MRLIAWTMLLLLLPAPVAAQEAPFDLNGLALGSDLAAVEGSSKFACVDSQSPAADKLCRLRPGQSESVAGTPVKRLFLYFYSKKLEMISVTLDAKHFVDVVTALTRQYGKATVETETMQNASGASFENRIYTWRRGSASLEVQTYGRDLENSSMIYRTDFSLQEYTRRSGAKAPDKAKSQ
jgi:hypothetical protein